VAVTGDAGERFAGAGAAVAVDLLDDRRVTLAAGGLGDGAVALGDADRVREAAGGEGEGMIPAVDRLGRVLRDQSRGRVAVVADRDRAVARLGPGAVLLLHHVAVGAGARIVGQVRRAARVAEGVEADPGGQSD